MDYEYYGKLLSKNKQDSMAIVYLYKGLHEDSTNMDLLDIIAASYANMKQYEKAAHVVELKVSKTQANLNPQDYYSIATYYFQAGKYAKADTNYAIVVKYYPSWPIGYLFRAKSNANIDSMMKTGAAKPYYEKFLEVSAPDAAKYKSEIVIAEGYLSFYYYNKKDYDKAKEYCVKVKELDPNNDQNNKLLNYITDIQKKKK
jgi:tetratricopeptide (TPR) repeat protein